MTDAIASRLKTTAAPLVTAVTVAGTAIAGVVPVAVDRPLLYGVGAAVLLVVMDLRQTVANLAKRVAALEAVRKAELDANPVQ